MNQATNKKCCLLSSSSICGDDVKNPKGESIGSVKDVMIDTASGNVKYAVLDFGGFLGIGNKLFAVPWSALQVNTADKCLVMDVEKKTLENAEGFDQDNWPNFADQTWSKKNDAYYRATSLA